MNDVDSQWLDVVFVPLFLLGVEHISPVHGTNGGYGQVIINADYTHSLIGALALSALFGLASANRWGARAARCWLAWHSRIG